MSPPVRAAALGLLLAALGCAGVRPMEPRPEKAAGPAESEPPARPLVPARVLPLEPAPPLPPEKVAEWSALLADELQAREARAQEAFTQGLRAEQRLARWLRPGTDLRPLNACALEAVGADHEAQDLWGALLGDCPASPEVLRRYAAASVRLGEVRQAAEALGGLVEKDPKNVEARGVLGWLLLRLDEPAKARTELEATRATPRAAEFALFLARARWAGGDLEGAAEAARLASTTAHWAGPAWSLLAEIQRARGLATLAEEAYRKALALDATDYSSTVGLGILRLGQGDVAQAETLFARAAELAPGAPEAWNDLGLARRARGDYEGAEAAFQKALDAAASFAPALKNLGILNEKYLGRPQLAVGYYDRYLAVRPGDAEVERWKKVAARATEGEKP